MKILKFLNFCPSLYQIAIEGAKRSSVAVPSITSKEYQSKSYNDSAISDQLTCVKMPVVPQGLCLQPGGVLVVAGIFTPDPDQNQPLTRRGWSVASVKHLTQTNTDEMI